MTYYAARHKVTKEYWLEGNGSDRVWLYQDPKSFTDHAFKPEFWRYYGFTIVNPHNNTCRKVDPSEMEIVEYIIREPFNMLNEHGFEVQGKAEISTIEIEEPDYDEERGQLNKNAEGDTLFIKKNYLKLVLNSGSAAYGISHRTEEGYESYHYLVTESKDSELRPVWKIEISNRSRDCDGVMEREYTCYSYGGTQTIDDILALYQHVPGLPLSEEEKKEAIFEHNKMLHQSKFLEMNQTSQRDHSAEAMGY